MAQTKSRSSGSSSSGRRTSAARSGKGGASRNGRTGGSSSSASRSASTRSPSTRSRSRASQRRASSQRASGNGVVETVKGTAGTAAQAAGQAGRFAVRNAVVPIASAAVGAAAGVIVGQRRMNRSKKVLGVPIPWSGAGGIDGLAKNVGEASKQFGRLANEVKTSREKAEQIGKALS
jgi:hypothetical protein